ncbi:MAG: hypothetical protein R6W76_10980, partial [Caldilinea sp.]
MGVVSADVGFPSVAPSSPGGVSLTPDWYVAEADDSGGAQRQFWGQASSVLGLDKPIDHGVYGEAWEFVADWAATSGAASYKRWRDQETEEWLKPAPFTDVEIPDYPRREDGTLANPFEEYARQYDPDGRWQSEAIGAFAGTVGGYITPSLVSGMESFRASGWGAPLAEIGKWFEFADHLKASPMPFSGLSLIEQAWGPVDAFSLFGKERIETFQEKWSAVPGFERGGHVPIERTGEYLTDLWQVVSSIPGDIGVMYDVYRTMRDPATYAEGPVTSDAYIHDLAWSMRETHDIFKPGPTIEQNVAQQQGLDDQWRTLALAAYGVKGEGGQSLSIGESYQLAANWLTARAGQVTQMREEAANVALYAKSGVAVIDAEGNQYTPQELNYLAAYLHGQSNELEQMDMAGWVDENVSLLQRIGWDVGLDWSELAFKSVQVLGMTAAVRRASKAGFSMLHLSEVDAARRVARGLAGPDAMTFGQRIGDTVDSFVESFTGKRSVGELFGDERGSLQLWYSFDPQAQTFRFDAEQYFKEGALDAPIEFREVDLTAAYGMHAPSAEDVVLGLLDRNEQRRAARAAEGRIHGAWDEFTLLDSAIDLPADYGIALSELRVSEVSLPGRSSANLPVEVRSLPVPPAARTVGVDTVAHDDTVLERLSAFMARQYADFQGSWAPTLQADDVFGRIAQRDDAWGAVGALAQQIIEQTDMTAGRVANLSLPAGLELGSHADLQDVLSRLQAMGASAWTVLSSPADVLASGQVSVRMGGLLDDELDLLKKIEAGNAFSSAEFANPGFRRLFDVVMGADRSSALGYADEAAQVRQEAVGGELARYRRGLA